MNRTLSRTVVVWLALVATAGLALPAAAEPVDCANPRGVGQSRACAAAREGTESLRRFLQRTQAIYGLSILDFDREVRPAVAGIADDRAPVTTLASRD
jgi:hypothetical protein